ncbi:Glycoside Hydrolase Family 9 protein [Trametes cinnabarina]|uniref:cellulase n=1 Tax=Pycnoporus cinnabarinus TaxID=5643 RepID=A0A060SQV9_PYCCI|nr:Glycoside Hydrolase Family 9 protein [Trametes cinnabarina]
MVTADKKYGEGTPPRRGDHAAQRPSLLRLSFFRALMLFVSALEVLLVTLPSVLAQLAPPETPYEPPDPSAGTQPSNGTTPNPQWSVLLGNLLYFYDEQRSGKLPANERVSWRNDSALDDGSDVGLDLSGGYYDAGDYVKYTFPLSFTLMSVCWGALDAGQGYDLANQTAYLDDMLRWGLDWLAHPSPNTLFVQVGDGNLDNAYWGGDKSIPGPRPSYQINDTSPGTDAAAQAAAAFAACSSLYSNRTLISSSTSALANTSYAATLQNHARQLYTFATGASGGMQTYQTAVPQSADAYASSGYSDELSIAALFLALTETDSNATSYYADAVKWYYSGNLGQQLHAGDETVFNWDSKTPGIAVLAAQIVSAYPNVVSGSNATLGVWQSAVEGYFHGIVNGTGRSHLTNGGLLIFPGDSDEASLNPALNVAMLMMRYASANLTTSQDAQNRYIAFAQNQLDYVLGKNPMAVPYVVGQHPNSPANPHSAISTGYAPPNGSLTAPDNLDTDPAKEAYVLYGGVVGGPDEHDRFWDLRSDWVENEVALDYTAPLLTLAAQALVRGAGDPYYTQVKAGAYDDVRPSGFPCDAAIQTGCKRSGLSTGGKIAVGVVVSVVGVIIIALGAYWVWRARRNSRY